MSRRILSKMLLDSAAEREYIITIIICMEKYHD